jgi:periplasmic protein TonB
MSLTLPKPSFFTANRNVVIAGSVLLFHALAIWALQTGLLMRAVEMIVPVEILAQMVELPTPKADPASPKPPEPVKQVVSKPKQVTQVAPTLLAVADATPTPDAPSVQPIAPPAPYVPTVAVAAVTAPAPPAAPKIVLPSSDADYLNNPKAKYPRASHAMREEGTVRFEVLIGANGLPQDVKLNKSSGYERLDSAALEVIKTWKFTPGTSNGVPMAMSRIVPYTFKIVD